MPKTRKLSEMRLGARRLSDMVGSTFISDDELTEIVNRHCQALYDLLLEVRGQLYFGKGYDITCYSDQTVYDLPHDFYQLVGSPIISSGGKFYQLKTWEENERARLLNLNNSYPSDARYRLVAGKIEIIPSPQTSWTLKLRYVPTFTKLVDDSDTFDGINGWEEWVELNSAIDMLAKEESDTSIRQAQLMKVEARIRRLAPVRDAANPPRIVDTRRDWYGIFDDFNNWDY